MNFNLLFAGGQNSTGGGLMAYLPFILILAIMYLLMIRPQAKRQKEKQKIGGPGLVCLGPLWEHF